MDGSRLDAVARTLTRQGTRRGLLALLAALPLPGALAALLAEEAEATSRRRQQLHDAAKKKHKNKKKKKKHAPPPTSCSAQICAGCCAGTGICQPGNTPDACGAGGAACGVCPANHGCAHGTCTPPTCGNGGPCLVFVTSTTYNGNLGGLSGADAECQLRAVAGNVPGVYKAWLADDTNQPATRFVHSSGPYRLVNGTTVANNWDDLTDETLDAAISVTELNTSALGTDYAVWTNTYPNGVRYSGYNCQNWTSASSNVSGEIGVIGPTDARWTAAEAIPCNFSEYLYCFQQS